MKYLFLIAVFLITIQALQPRQKAPTFVANAVLPDKSIGKISLEDYKGKYLAIVFYPFDFTYVCPTELTSYSDSAPRFKSTLIFIKKSMLKLLQFQQIRNSLI